ncbi:MAG: hypothetical protein IOMNBAOH_00140 [Rhodocyclaceae bacterium]|nr:AAA family ATPase [Rhodocyclaceae bacterium]MCG3185630.1 hypothetical protein [Rhodocyclaceae bacterium]
MDTAIPLAPERLRSACDPDSLPFQDTSQLTPLPGPLGQDRAIAAVRVAMGIPQDGFNVFVVGTPGVGRHKLAESLLRELAATRETPDDWCYLNDFSGGYRPAALRLPAGVGKRLCQAMQQFASELGPAIAAAFDTDDYRARVEAIQDEFKQREETALRELGDASAAQGIALLRTPQGLGFAPLKGNETMDPEAFAALPDDEKKRLSALIEAFGERLRKLIGQFPRWHRQMQERLREVSRSTLQLAAGHLIDDIRDEFGELPQVSRFLDAVLADVIEVGEALREGAKQNGEGLRALAEGTLTPARYHVNLFVAHEAGAPVPVVCEDNPGYQNLMGRIDHMPMMGTLVTNFTLIRPGALHRANGGFLVLDAEKVLGQSFSWDSLKRALKSRQIRIETPAQLFGLGAGLPLEPEPIPLSVKVVLIGNRYTYQLLKEYDPEFDALFKVTADMEDRVTRDADHAMAFARVVADLTRTQNLLPLDREAVAHLVDESARRADDAGKLSVRLRWLADLLVEADHLARQADRALIGGEQVVGAIDARIRRADQPRQVHLDALLSDTLLIDTEGAAVGQINALAVTEFADFRYANPVRVTATVRLGDGQVVDIERESELGGPIHSKGVMILSAFLATRYASERPLSLSASLVFEQSYGLVEGDSASLAELCALLSALADLPIRQTLAITGSVNQLGRVQAIGGVNEKIEGFFDLVRARGQLRATGEHGVIIPESNVRHLMLRADVVAAVAAGEFCVWAVNHVDQAIERLTGVAAGVPDERGLLPAGSVHHRVSTRLGELVRRRAELGHRRRREDSPKGKRD